MSESNKTKTIRVSEDTIKMLGKEREGFETPDQCIQRILSDQACKKAKNKADDTSHESHYDTYGNYWTYDEEKKIWIGQVDSKNLKVDQ